MAGIFQLFLILHTIFTTQQEENQEIECCVYYFLLFHRHMLFFKKKLANRWIQLGFDLHCVLIGLLCMCDSQGANFTYIVLKGCITTVL